MAIVKKLWVHSILAVVILAATLNIAACLRNMLKTQNGELPIVFKSKNQQNLKNNLVTPDITDIKEKRPIFLDPIRNVTVMAGRNAILSCMVKNLGKNKIAWVKVDTETILSLGTNLITRDNRFKVSQSNDQNWYLHVTNVNYDDDRGYYMCQVNTKPMIHRNIHLTVLVPPKLIESETSSDMTVKEFKSVSLRCRASGHPKPTITWQREDSKQIVVDSPHHRNSLKHQTAQKWMEGDYLNISRVTRAHMGAYFCVAANQVPPSVSKRIVLQVTFAPKIKVPHQLVGSPEGSEVRLKCYVEAFPIPMTSWKKYDKLIVSDNKYQSTKTVVDGNSDQFTTIMTLSLANLKEDDFGAYTCIATNILGTKEGLIRLYKTETFTNKITENVYAQDSYPGHVMLKQPFIRTRKKHANGSRSVYSAKVLNENSTIKREMTHQSLSSKSKDSSSTIHIQFLTIWMPVLHYIFVLFVLF